MGRKGKTIDADMLRSAYEETGSIKKLAQIFHTSNNRMTKLLAENNITTKKVGNKIEITKKNISSIVKDYTNYNMTMKEICKKYGLKVDKIRDIFRENGICAYKWHGHVKKNDFTKIGFIKKIASILEENNINYTINFNVTTNLIVGLMANGICIDVYKNKGLVDSIRCKKRTMLLKRRDTCVKNGFKYIQIFEDEFKDKPDIVLSKIKHQFRIDNGFRKVGGRKCVIEKISKEDAEKFLNCNHIQGFVGSTVHVGAKYNGELIGVMSFLNENDNMWNLTRFATLNGCVCQGVGGKIFSWFLKEYKPYLIRSFADKRWTVNSDSNVYTKLGFKYEYSTIPGYTYCNGTNYKRIRRERFRKPILIKKYNLDDNMTELEMARSLGYDRIWDCGLFKYVWRSEN